MQNTRKTIKSLFAAALFLVGSNLVAQDEIAKGWSPIFEKEVSAKGERVIVPEKYKVYRVDQGFKNLLFSAPHENSVNIQSSPITIKLPMPDGTLENFKVVEAPVMEAELAAQFPQIKTFNVLSVDHPGTYGKVDWTEFGFHGMIFSPEGRVFIDPYSRNNMSEYITYYTTDFSKPMEERMIPECGDTDFSTERLSNPPNAIMANIFCGTILRTYRFAVACTGEYAVAATGLPSPTTAQILSVVTTSVNRVDGVYETEGSIRLVLVANETSILFGNAGTDPFTGNSNAPVLINESQTVITSNIGSANYDIGHTFSTGGGGLAGLGVVCTSSQKARGITGSPSPVGDAYDIDYVAHEVGHQFSGNHSYNECAGNATQNPGTMVEPGGGVTIMGYAGICAAADNIAMNSIAYFHTISFDEIMTFTQTGNGNVCPTKPNTGNNIPVVTGSANYTIPRSTPFTLTGSATDADGDVLTYSWEEFDNNSTAHAVGTAAPYFRSLVPVSTPSRTFPRLSTVLTGATSNLGEYLPSTAGTLNFRLTARDNKMGGGGVSYAANQVVIAASGPFAVTYPNATGITWASGSTQTVTWSVNSTNTAPVSCANVKISLSTDGGNTFPTVILASTPNDGTQSITVPNYGTNQTTCRIKIESVGNIFFDISDNNFTITATASPIAAVNIALTAGSNPMCPGASATFSATPVNGGSSPSYQWQVDGVNVGTNSTSYTTTSLTNGQVVTCIMTSNLSGVVGSPATSNGITMTVGNTVPSVTISGSTVLCAGSSYTYTATPVNGGGAPTYQWQVDASNVGTNSSTYTTSTLTNGQAITCIMTSNAGCQATPTVTSNTITVTVNNSVSLPFTENFEAVTFPPTGWVLQNADAGAVAWGTAGAKGIVRRAAAGNTGSTAGSAAIELYNYNTDTTQVDNLLTVPVNLSGATSPRMTFKRAYKYYNDGTNPNNYHDELRVYVSTDCGATFGAPLYYKKGVQLASNGTSNATFTPAVAADWDIDTISLAAYVNMSVIVKFEITNRYGNNLYLDDINIASVAGAIPTANFTSGATKCAGQVIAFTDASTNTPTSWAWATTPSTGVTIASASSQNPNITFTNAGTYTVSLIATNANGSSPSYTQAVTVNATPSMTSATTAAICSGNAVGHALTSSVASGYSWIAAANANVTGESTTAQAGATITNTLTATSVQTVTYSVTPTATTGGCVGAVQTVSITVNPTPVMTSATTASVCSGNAVGLALTSGVASSYSWIAAANANVTGESTTAQSGATITNTLTATSVQTVTYSVTPTSTTGSCVGATQTVTVTVNPTPAMTSGSTAAICSGNAVGLALTSSVASSYSWIAASNANVTGESTTTQSGATITNTLTATSVQTVTYSVAPTSTAGSCVGATQTVTVTVNPIPAMTSATSTNVCSGNAVGLALTSNVASSFSWIAASNTNVTGESTTAQSTSTINNTLTAATAQTVTYSVTPTSTSGSCAGSTQTVTVNVIPAPSMTSANAISICTGSSVGLALTSNIASTYSWQAANTPNVTGESTTAQAGSTITNTLSITGTTPRTVTYSVTPTSTSGSCAGTVQTVTVTVNPIPVISAMSNITNVCSGALVTVPNFTVTTGTLSWANNNTSIGLGANGTGNIGSFTSSTVSSPTTGAITANASVGGCNAVPQAFNITINPLPTVTATSNPASATVCAGSNITLSGGGATSYTWTGGVTNGVAFTPASSATYTVTGTDANGCVNIATQAVTVNSLPTVTASVNPASAAVCAGSNITLTGGGAASYTWSGGVSDGVAFTPASTATYTVTGTDANGCVNIATQAVTVNPAVTALNLSSTPATCGSADGAIDVTGQTGGTAPYMYSLDGGTSSASTTFSGLAAGTYTITVTDANGCGMSNTANVTTLSGPSAQAVSNVNSTCGNANGVITFGATTGGVGPYTYSIDGINFSTATSYTVAAGTYTCTVMDGSGCTFQTTTTVSNAGGPSAQAISNVNSTCGNTNGVINFGTTTGGTAAYSYSIDGVNFSTATSYTVAAGTYTCTVQDANGCSFQTTTTVSDAAAVVPSISQAGTTLTATSAVSYQWYLDGNLMPGETNQVLNATQNGNYTVETVDANGCTATSAVATVSGIGIKEVNSISGVNVYPNPNEGNFVVNAILDVKKEYVIELRNVLGQLISAEQIKDMALYTGSFDLNKNGAGVYFVIIADSDGASSVHKIIVE